ncbi:MAG: o-succinylbenzoate synthase [Actinomycetales bacterium]|nr:o-succinylbenzoate synthase [Actinomycetales bacterium]
MTPSPMTSLPSVAELLESAVPFRVRLRTRFRGVTHREGLLLRGPRGAGEFAPFDDYPASGAARWLAAAIDAGWGERLPAVRQAVRVNAIIPDGDIETTRAFARAAAESGCDTMKVKVGSVALAVPADAAEQITHDLRRIAVVRDCLDAEFGPGRGRIRLDVNAMWTAQQAVAAVPALLQAAGEIDYFEQPCETLAECAQVRGETGVRIAIDEGLRLAGDLDADTIAQVREAADVVIVKPIPLGGAAEVLRIAEQVQRPVVVSGSMDTSIGLSYVLAAACALPDLPYACGLGTGSLLAEDLAADTLVPVGGMMQLTQVGVDPDALRAHTIPADDPRHAWWLRRLREAAAHLPGLGSVAP